MGYSQARVTSLGQSVHSALKPVLLLYCEYIWANN